MTPPNHKRLILTRYPVNDAMTEAASAVAGARYHLDQIGKLFERPAMRLPWEWRDPNFPEATKAQYQIEVNQFHWHLRAFFWELVAAVDVLLVQVNMTHELEIAEDEIAWRTVKTAAERRRISSRPITMLKQTFESDWFTEVRGYRNFAHRGQLITIFDVSEDGNRPPVGGLFPARDGQERSFDLLHQLRGYLEKMQELIHRGEVGP